MSTRLLDEMRDLMRRRHYSIHTERAYRDWVKRYVRFHNMQSRDDLRHGEEKIEAFLTHLARDRQVAASTQNQAMNALVFLYKHVLEQPLNGEINADRARRKVRIPVVLTREETARVIARLSGVHQLIVKLLYGSGLRITECLRLRVQDLDLEMKALTVRNGKGDKDRITTFPAKLVQPLTEHLVRVKAIHGQDMEEGHGRVYLPHALARKYPHADKDWRWPSSPLVIGPLTRAPAKFVGITSTPAPSTRPLPRSSARRESASGSVRIRSCTALPLISCNEARTFAPSKPCWDTRTSVPP